MDIKVISRETIKPSSPTPPHLKHWKLSLIDQCTPPTLYGRVIFFYSAQGDLDRFERANMSDRLKRSLSAVLTEFYPLAGRYSGNKSVDCIDDGLEYIEARVKAPLTLDQFVTTPNAEALNVLVPYGTPTSNVSGSRRLSAVQVTVFDACGGMVVGFSVSHLLADGTATAAFMDRWAAIARVEGNPRRTPDQTVAAKLSLASLLPPIDIPVPEIVDYSDSPQDARKLVSKRFVFPQSKINTLRSKIKYQRPTRVEAVSAVIFKCLINVSNSTSSKSVVLGTTVNLRTRTSPPLPAHYFGSMVFPFLTKPVGPETSLSDLGLLLRQLTREIDGDYVKKLQADDASLLWEKILQLVQLCTNNDIRTFLLTSWCNFSFGGVDLGWGAPTWVAPAFFNGQDGALLLDSKNGDGIEAWLVLDEDDMARFESELANSTGPKPIISKL